MNSSLTDIQSDIQRLASQQSQLQAVQQQNIIAQQQKQIQQLQQQMYAPQIYQQPSLYAAPNTLQSSASAPHIPQSLYQQSRIPEQPQFFLHDQSPPPPPVIAPRRTWAQQAVPSPQPIPLESYQPELRTWSKVGGQTGFVLHEGTGDRFVNFCFGFNKGLISFSATVHG